MKIQHRNMIGVAVSNVGLVRGNNEDNFLLGHCLNEHSSSECSSSFCQRTGEWTCLGVFDGMGGIDGGEVASGLAARTFQEKTFELNGMEQKDIVDVIEKAYIEANQVIIDERKQRSTSGTTGSVVVTDGVQFRVFHRGDSRVYLMRNNEMQLLTKDQTLAQLKLDVGIYHGIEDVPEKEHHQLTEYIGMDLLDEGAKPFQREWMEWEDGDRLLLCSDGLYDMCSDEKMSEVMSSGLDAQKTAEELLQIALKNGGWDNVTILVLELV